MEHVGRARFPEEGTGRTVDSIETYADSGVNVSDVEDFTSLDGWFQLYRGCGSFIVCGFLRGICAIDSILFYFAYIFIRRICIV